MTSLTTATDNMTTSTLDTARRARMALPKAPIGEVRHHAGYECHEGEDRHKARLSQIRLD